MEIDSKSKAAYEYISQQIESGAFPPGMMLVERQLCEQLGMSRSPVRTALTRLANEGELVTYTPNRGMCVTALTRRDVEEIYELRILLDSEGLRLFIRRASDAEIAELGELYGKMIESYERGDIEEMVRYDVLFHRYYTSHCGNTRLHAMFRTVFSPLRRFRWEIVRMMPESIAEIQNLHAKLYEAIQARDEDSACKYEKMSNEAMMQHHLRWLDAQQAKSDGLA